MVVKNELNYLDLGYPSCKRCRIYSEEVLGNLMQPTTTKPSSNNITQTLTNVNSQIWSKNRNQSEQGGNESVLQNLGRKIQMKKYIITMHGEKLEDNETKSQNPEEKKQWTRAVRILKPEI